MARDPDDDPNDPSHPDHDLSEAAPWSTPPRTRGWHLPRWIILIVAFAVIIGMVAPYLFNIL
jgi:hypothetical protein